MIKYKTTITTITIIAQIDKLVKNCFNFELVLKKAGRTNINTAINEIAGTICSQFIYFSKNFLLFERIA